MDKPGFRDSLDQFSFQRHVWRWWSKTVAVCAILGGVYGTLLGSAIGADPAAAGLIEMAATIMALICAGPGARYGFFFGFMNRLRFGMFFVGTIAAIGGAILGGLLATMVLLAPGAILGAVGGWVLARALIALRHGILRRFLVGIAGAGLGTVVGAVLWALRTNQAGAIHGAVWGLGIGVVVGPLLLLLFFASLRSLPRAYRGDRANVIDANFEKPDREQGPAE